MVAAKQMRGGRPRFAVAALQPVVAEIFAISRFDHADRSCRRCEEALAQASGAALAAYRRAGCASS